MHALASCSALRGPAPALHLPRGSSRDQAKASGCTGCPRDARIMPQPLVARAGGPAPWTSRHLGTPRGAPAPALPSPSSSTPSSAHPPPTPQPAQTSTVRSPLSSRPTLAARPPSPSRTPPAPATRAAAHGSHGTSDHTQGSPSAPGADPASGSFPSPVVQHVASSTIGAAIGTAATAVAVVAFCGGTSAAGMGAVVAAIALGAVGGAALGEALLGTARDEDVETDHDVVVGMEEAADKVIEKIRAAKAEGALPRRRHQQQAPPPTQ